MVYVCAGDKAGGAWACGKARLEVCERFCVMLLHVGYIGISGATQGLGASTRRQALTLDFQSACESSRTELFGTTSVVGFES